MRTFQIISLIFTMAIGVTSYSQTPEQVKMMEKAQRQYDSIMNTPEMKKQMLETEKISKQIQAANAKKKAEATSVQKTVAVDQPNEKHRITKSSKMKFDDWSYGNADIILQTDGRYSKATETKVGSVQANGYFDFTLPEKVTTFNAISNDRFLNCGNYNNKTKWTRPQMSYSKGNLLIRNNNIDLGRIFLTSAREIIDEETLANDYHGIPGYSLGLYYLVGETSGESNCVIQRRYGEGKDFDLSQSYNLQLEPGWNIVRFEYSGDRINIDWGEGEHNKHSYYKEKKIYVVSDLPDDIKWYFRASQ